MQSTEVGTIERAFQLARSGACHTIADIRNKLYAEGYDGVHGHLMGAAIQQQLKTFLAARGIKATSGIDDDGLD